MYICNWSTLNKLIIIKMCISLFLNYQTIKGILHIHITFLKNIRQMFLFFTYQFVQIFITYNRTDVSLFKQVSKYNKEKDLS